MSGPICPDCLMFDYITENSTKCSFCNWQGKPLPRKTLSASQLGAYGIEQREMKADRKKGKLFFVRVYVKSNKFMDDDSACADLMEALDVDYLDGPYHNPPYFFNKVKNKPTKKQLEYLNNIPGVMKITVY